MYLSNFKIINFRNNMNTSFDFSNGVNTIIGENDSGKSNAITAMRMLLDESYYVSIKNLKESDFSFALNDWRGHWIIISSEFSEITNEEMSTESIAEICADTESERITANLIGSMNNKGYFTLFIRPNKAKRTELSHATDLEDFNFLRSTITLNDYEVVFTGRASSDFSDSNIYREIVGDFETGEYCDPDYDDESVLGYSIDSRTLQSHFSIITVNALRDVETELRKGKNPIRRMIENIQSKISETNLDAVSENIENLNTVISNIEQIKDIGGNINANLDSMIGSLYSPTLRLESQMNNEITQLSRFISLKPTDLGDINLLGLGRLNMIYIALKLTEFELNRTREILNIMLIEEPEAHIHNHIQRTLFNNMSTNDKYTQVVLTTHSVHISEVSEISRLNVMKMDHEQSIVMQPTNELDIFGRENLNLGAISLTNAVERYLDSKRSVLMFSKSVLLIEGDGEEILIPNLVLKTLGLTLDELGIGIINIGSVAFEYIASIFSDNRIRKKCAILTDSDKQAVAHDNTYFKAGAEELGRQRKTKLEGLFDDNQWVNMFYSDYTLEIDFINYPYNKSYVEEIVDDIFQQEAAKERHKEKLMSESLFDSAAEILALVDKLGKGWFSTLLSTKLDCFSDIPEYIIDAIAFVASDSFTLKSKFKMIKYVFKEVDDDDVDFEELIHNFIETPMYEEYIKLEQEFVSNYGEYSAAKLLVKLNEMQVE